MKPKITSISTDGEVIITTEKAEYFYYIDAALIPELQRTYNTGKVFNLLKQKGRLINKKEIK